MPKFKFNVTRNLRYEVTYDSLTYVGAEDQLKRDLAANILPFGASGGDFSYFGYQDEGGDAADDEASDRHDPNTAAGAPLHAGPVGDPSGEEPEATFLVPVEARVNFIVEVVDTPGENTESFIMNRARELARKAAASTTEPLNQRTVGRVLVSRPVQVKS